MKMGFLPLTEIALYPLIHSHAYLLVVELLSRSVGCLHMKVNHSTRGQVRDMRQQRVDQERAQSLLAMSTKHSYIRQCKCMSQSASLVLYG